MRAARVAGVKLLIERGRARSPAAALPATPLGAWPRGGANRREGGPTCSRGGPGRAPGVSAAQPQVLVGLEDDEVARLDQRTPIGHRGVRSQREPAVVHHGAVEGLALGGEVGEQEQALAGVLAQQAEDVVVAGPQRLAGALRVGGARGAARGDEPAQAVPQAALDRLGVRRGARRPSSPSAGRCIQRLSSRRAGSPPRRGRCAGPARRPCRRAAGRRGRRRPRRAAGCAAAPARAPAGRRSRAPPRGPPARRSCRSCAPPRSADPAESACRARSWRGSRPRRSRPGSAGADGRPRPPRRRPPP